jgi:transcriptional regulator with PAS, ATPase and Fis domain
MEWFEKLDGNVIVCDANGIVIYMNETAIRNYEKDGGAALIGQNLLDCHNETSRKKIMEIMTTHQKNVYTIEKRGRKKIIYQTPWMDGELFKGIVELSLEIPFEMLHYQRD